MADLTSDNPGGQGAGMPTGAHVLSDAEMRGYSYSGADVTYQNLPTSGKTIARVNPGAMGYNTPGPTGPLRGVEANTARANRSNSTPITSVDDISAEDLSNGWRQS